LVTLLLYAYRFSIPLFFFFLLIRPPPPSTLFPYTTLFRSGVRSLEREIAHVCRKAVKQIVSGEKKTVTVSPNTLESLIGKKKFRSEEHTSELQSRFDLVCRLLLEKKKNRRRTRRESQSASR